MPANHLPRRAPLRARALLLAVAAFCGVAGLGAAGDAGAQVMRCTDARGKVTYTDGSCDGATSAREVEPRKTPQEIDAERSQAAEALARKQQRLQVENAELERDNARLRAERERAAQQQQQQANAPRDYARSPECAASRRRVESLSAGAYGSLDEQARVDSAQRQADLDCLGPAAYAELEKARAAQPRVVVVPPVRRPGGGVFPQPYPPVQVPQRRLTSCTDWQCTDNTGATYPRSGPNRFPGPGGVCRSSGGQAPC